MKYRHLIKPKHRLEVKLGGKVRRVHAGFYESRDARGTEVHWAWLTAHWHHAADLEVARERRRLCA